MSIRSALAAGVAALVAIPILAAGPVAAVPVKDFDGVYVAQGNVLRTTCVGDTPITNEFTLPDWFFVVKDGQIDDGLLGVISGPSGSATMTVSSVKLGGEAGVDLTGPATFAVLRDGGVHVEGTLTGRYSPVCTQTLFLTASTMDAFTFNVRSQYVLKRGQQANITLCEPRQKGKCGWPKVPDNPHSTDPQASFSFTVAHFSFTSPECAPFGNRCGFLPRGLKLNLFTGEITGTPKVKPGRYPVRLCANEFSSSKRVCKATTFVVK